MGQVLTKLIHFNEPVKFSETVMKIQNIPDVFDIRRKSFIDKNKYVINFAYKKMVVENTGLFHTTSFARFQMVFTCIEPTVIQLATEYGFIGSASTMLDAEKMNKIVEDYLKDNIYDDVVDAEFKDIKEEKDDFISSADKLLKAKELYDKGAITSYEYEELKNKFMKDALK